MTFEEWWEEDIPGANKTKSEIDVQVSMLTLVDNGGEDAFSLYKAMKHAFESGYNSGWDDYEEAYCPRLNQGI